MSHPLFNIHWKDRLFFTISDLLLKGLFIKQNGPISTPKRLLISNLAHFGDLVLTTALFEPLLRSFPGLEIGLMTSSESKKVVEGHPLISYFHTFDHAIFNRSGSRLKRIKSHRESARKAIREICSIHYDVALDLRFLPFSSASLLARAKIPTRIGFTSAGFSSLLTHPLPFHFSPSSSIVDSFFSLLSLLPSFEKPAVPKAFLPPLDPNIFHSLKKRFPLKEKEYLVIHMGSGNAQKEWPLEKWKKLSSLLQREGHTLLFTGRGHKENNAISSVVTSLNNQAFNLADQLSWEELVALIKHAKALLSVDTAAGHVASAMETPALLLYTSINPLSLWAPLGPFCHQITKALPCSPCYQGCEKMSCVKEIEVEEVYSAFQQLNQ